MLTLANPLRTLRLPGFTPLFEAGRIHNLEELALTAPRPSALDDLADRCGAPRLLLHRVAARRQGLPRALVAPIAQLLGLRPGDVELSAGEVVEGSSLSDRTALTPFPPDRCLGDPVYQRPLAPTVYPTFGTP